MNSEQKNKAKNSRPNPGSESRSFARFFQKTARFLKSSDSESKAKAKQQHEERNPQGSVPVDLRHQSSSTPLSPNHLAPQSSTTISPSQQQPTYISSTITYGPQTTLVGDDNRGNVGIIGHNAINFLVQQFFHSSQAGERSTSIKLSSMIIAIIFMEATQKVLGVLFGNVITNSATGFEKNGSEGKIVEENFRCLIESIKSAMERDDSSIRQALRIYLKDLWSKLCWAREQLSNPNNNSLDVEVLSHDILWKLRLFLFLSHMGGYIPPGILVEGVKKRIVKLLRDAEAAAPRQMIKDLPRANTAYDEYVSSHQRRVSCFEGTRQALLEEMGDWVAKAESGIFVLFGLAGIGKSTIAQTVAERADNVRLLGASFFFSRDEAERRTAERFFTTIASQLRVHDPEFGSAIESVLMTEQGKDAITKFPLDQLETLILDPLRGLTPRKVVVVIDALDECDAKDIGTVLVGLVKVVEVLPSFKVILTTRPQPQLQLLRDRLESQKVLDLHDIEDKVIDGDIERYLRHKLSLEEVKACLPNLRDPWAASDDDIKSLVRAAGRLFIIASTAVLFILDKTSTPAKRMKLLLSALEKGHTPFKALNNFYTTILRSAVPENSEDDTRDCYQTVIGTIILLQQPLIVSALAKLIDVEMNDITIILGNLQPVILLGSDDIPLTYHKSFPDYIQDPTRCKDENLRIDHRSHHTRIAVHCIRLLNLRLKENILDLSGPARFMDNGDALVKQGLTADHIQEKIPTELQYACLYFANHFENANVEDTELATQLEQFFNERLLNWLEALSWIGKANAAHRILLMVQKQLKPTSSDLQELMMDGLRFVSKFYRLIGRSALHTYHSALPLTPTKTRLFEKYTSPMTFCQVLGGREKWDEVIATMEFGSSKSVGNVVFSTDCALLACCVVGKEGSKNGSMTIHDAVAGITLGRIESRIAAIANDFSKAVGFVDNSITLYDVQSFIPVTTVEFPATVVKLALSPDGSRLLAGLDDATVRLWDAEKREQIKSFSGWEKDSEMAFSSDGSRATFISSDGVVKLVDGLSGRTVADMKFPGLESSILKFSGDGSRLACLSRSGSRSLRVWDSQDGALIRAADKDPDVAYMIAISIDGSLLVTRRWQQDTLLLFSGDNLATLEALYVKFRPSCLAIHRNDLIAVGSIRLVAVYDYINDGWIAHLSFLTPGPLTFSPDGARIAVGDENCNVWLLDVSSIATSNITASNISSRGELTCKCDQLAFSPNCSRLVSGQDDGTIKLWDTTNMAEIAHNCHSNRTPALAFSVDGEEFASGARDGVIRFWSGKDGAPSSVLECEGVVWAVAFSNNMLAASTGDSITVWDLKDRSVIATGFGHKYTNCLTFSHQHSLLATAHRGQVALWDLEKRKLVTIFELTDSGGFMWRSVRRMTFLPDDSLLAVQDHYDPFVLHDHYDDDNFYLFNTQDSETSESQVSMSKDICSASLCTSWHGIPVWVRGGGNIVGRFPQQEEAVAVFNYPNDFHVSTIAQGASMIALGCTDGCIRLIKAV